MIKADVNEAFEIGDTEKARKLWVIFIRSMDIIEYYPEEPGDDLKRLESLYNDYTEIYYPEEKGVI